MGITVSNLVAGARARGVEFRIHAGRLQYRDGKRALTERQRDALDRHREQIAELIRGETLEALSECGGETDTGRCWGNKDRCPLFTDEEMRKNSASRIATMARQRGGCEARDCTVFHAQAWLSRASAERVQKEQAVARRDALALARAERMLASRDGVDDCADMEGEFYGDEFDGGSEGEYFARNIQDDATDFGVVG